MMAPLDYVEATDTFNLFFQFYQNLTLFFFKVLNCDVYSSNYNWF